VIIIAIGGKLAEISKVSTHFLKFTKHAHIEALQTSQGASI
jgi:hypothetical protein